MARMEGSKPQEKKKANKGLVMMPNITGRVNKTGTVPTPRKTAPRTPPPAKGKQ